MTPQEALDRIAALRNESLDVDDEFQGYVDTDAIWAIVAEVEPQPSTFPRQAVIDAYQETWEEWQRPHRPGHRFRDVLADRLAELWEGRA